MKAATDPMAFSGDSKADAQANLLRLLIDRVQDYAMLVQSVEDYAIFMLDPTGRVTTWNAGAQRIKGYTAEEITGQHFSSKWRAVREKARPLPCRFRAPPAGVRKGCYNFTYKTTRPNTL